MYLLNDADHQALMLMESAAATALTWPACDQAAALRAIRDDLRIILRNTVKDEPVGYVYGKDTP